MERLGNFCRHFNMSVLLFVNIILKCTLLLILDILAPSFSFVKKYKEKQKSQFVPNRTA